MRGLLSTLVNSRPSMPSAVGAAAAPPPSATAALSSRASSAGASTAASAGGAGAPPPPAAHACSADTRPIDSGESRTTVTTRPVMSSATIAGAHTP